MRAAGIAAIPGRSLSPERTGEKDRTDARQSGRQDVHLAHKCLHFRQTSTVWLRSTIAGLASVTRLGVLAGMIMCVRLMLFGLTRTGVFLHRAAMVRPARIHHAFHAAVHALHHLLAHGLRVGAGHGRHLVHALLHPLHHLLPHRPHCRARVRRSRGADFSERGNSAGRGKRGCQHTDYPAAWRSIGQLEHHSFSFRA